MTPSEIAERINAVLDKKGWCQGSVTNTKGEVCLGGAFIIATTHEGRSFYRVNSPEDLLWKQLNWNLGPELGLPAGQVTISSEIRHQAVAVAWNDQPGRSVEDVKLAVKQAAADLEAIDGYAWK